MRPARRRAARRARTPWLRRAARPAPRARRRSFRAAALPAESGRTAAAARSARAAPSLPRITHSTPVSEGPAQGLVAGEKQRSAVVIQVNRVALAPHGAPRPDRDHRRRVYGAARAGTNLHDDVIDASLRCAVGGESGQVQERFGAVDAGMDDGDGGRLQFLFRFLSPY